MSSFDGFSSTPLEQRNNSVQQLVRLLFLTITLLLLIPAVATIVVLIVEGAPGLSLEFFLDKPRQNGAAGGIAPALVGTVWLTAGALLFALPLGVAAAIYLSEYAKDNWLTRAINVAIVNLAGVPSIVHALFGVGAFVHFMQFGKSILAASCTLAVMTLPVVIVATRESLQAVPKAFREACWNMGATRWQTIWKVVLPNSGSGILTGLILVVSRAVGETAPIMFTGAVFLRALYPSGVFDKTMALSLHLFNVSTQVNDVPRHVPFAVALTLIGVVLAMNAAAIALRMRLRGRKKW
ncbi:MAG: phosphate ABC transporter permease PstA [Planctomycetes bacterium]|nr:phosphate ABC transporter permease PstA [Planctomycetota bacterium]MCB9885098.1 phosphate ABC transporter permease PstA [Planctomycetota bacterium]